ncbi:WGR domain-containing protein [Agrobacterium sp. CG674]
MSYPIKVYSQSYDHANGTKSYHLMMIEASNGHCVFINRWGKKGTFGEMQVQTFATPKAAWKAYEKKETAKTRSGYAPLGSQRTNEATDAKTLGAAIGMVVLNKMGASNIKHLDPDYNTAGMREVDPPRTDEETGKLVGDTSRKADIAAQLEAEREERRKEAAMAYDDNEEFGIF